MANTASSKEKEKMGMTAKNRILSVIATGFFVVLCALVVFPVFAGLLASFRPGTDPPGIVSESGLLHDVSG